MNNMNNGDIYLNTVLGDLWIATGDELARVNDPKVRADQDEVGGFVLVGHADVMTKTACGIILNIILSSKDRYKCNIHCKTDCPNKECVCHPNNLNEDNE